MRVGSQSEGPRPKLYGRELRESEGRRCRRPSRYYLEPALFLANALRASAATFAVMTQLVFLASAARACLSRSQARRTFGETPSSSASSFGVNVRVFVDAITDSPPSRVWRVMFIHALYAVRSAVARGSTDVYKPFTCSYMAGGFSDSGPRHTLCGFSVRGPDRGLKGRGPRCSPRRACASYTHAHRSATLAFRGEMFARGSALFRVGVARVGAAQICTQRFRRNVERSSEFNSGHRFHVVTPLRVVVVVHDHMIHDAAANCVRDL